VVNEGTYRLTYDASVRAIEDQARVLEGLRSRAVTMFAAAALVTSFLGGTALAGPETGIAVLIATGAFIAAALLTLLILWPFRLRLSLSAREIIANLDANDVEPARLLRELGLQLEAMYDRNARTIRPPVLVLQAGYPLPDS
jgi:hypothetical protein